MTPTTSPLTTDLYELNMIQAYLDRGEDKTAVFEFFVRRLPARRNFLLAAGLDDVLVYLETLRFSAAEIDWLKSTGRFRDNLIDYLAEFRFTGDVHAIPEGTVCFPNEPFDPHHGPSAGGAAGRDAVDQHHALPDHDRLESCSHGSRGARKNIVRFRPAHGAWCGGRVVLRARQLHRRFCQRRQRACRRALRDPDCRDHGAFLRAGARRRDHRLRKFCTVAAGGRRFC